MVNETGIFYDLSFLVCFLMPHPATHLKAYLTLNPWILSLRLSYVSYSWLAWPGSFNDWKAVQRQLTSKVSSSFINQLIKMQQLLWELSGHSPFYFPPLPSLLFYFILVILFCFVFFLFVSSPRENLSSREMISETGAPWANQLAIFQ